MRALILVSLLGSIVAADPATPVPVVDVAESGRFVFKQVGALRRDIYMVDTKTGRLWQLVVRAGSSEEVVLSPVKYLDGAGKNAVMPEDTLADLMVKLKSIEGFPGLYETCIRSLLGIPDDNSAAPLPKK